MASLPIRCAQCAVRDDSLCAALDDREIAYLSEIARSRTVGKGQVVIWSNDPATICATVISGVLKLTTSTSDGREQTVGLLFDGDFVGDLFASNTHLTATALTNTELCVYPRGGFEQLLKEHPRLERALLVRTMASLDEARDRMLTLGRKSASEKVASFLVDMLARVATRTSSDGAISFDLPISRSEMADVLGTTIETVSRQLTRLKTQGVLATAGGRGLVVLNRQRLEQLQG